MEIIPCTILVQICQYSKISAFVTLSVKMIVLLWLKNFFFSLKEANEYIFDTCTIRSTWNLNHIVHHVKQTKCCKTCIFLA